MAACCQMITDLRKLSNHPLLMRNYYTDEALRSISTDLLQDKSHEGENPDTIFEDLSSMNDFQIHITCQLYSVSGPACLSVRLP